MEPIPEQEKVIFTGTIPQCPYCKIPTKRTGGGTTVTAAYFQPVYDETGKNINPDKNTRTSYWECLYCSKPYTISGNNADGYYYI